MSHPFRLLDTGLHDCYYNMGLDEALLESAAASGVPVLRFYGWSPPAVSIGYFQGLAEEIDAAACAARGFDLVRRISGGGAVLHKSELTYSIAMSAAHPLAGGCLNESYRILCGGLIEGLRILGLKAEFSGINDILVNGRKISGNAQTRKHGCLLQHGTVLLDDDIDAMFSVLKIPREKIKGNMAEVKDRVTNVKHELGREVPYAEAAAAFAKGFSSALGLELAESAVSPEEDELARKYAAEKFASKEWIFKR
jgi:lipoate-protein ligase A